jgi:hypothetical protein
VSRLRDTAIAGLLLILGAPCWVLGSVAAAETIHVDVPSECTAESRTSSTVYPFIDRVGDARFAPRPLTTAPTTVTLVQPGLGGLLVSAALMDDQETLLITTYHDILSTNIHTGKVTSLDVDLGNLSNKKYVPTGIFVGRRTGSVFLANYLANNVLIGHITGHHISFDQELTGDGLGLSGECDDDAG